jgi:hypothetical protein
MTAPIPPATRPPLGAWSRLYWLCAGLATAVLLLLWWFTATYNIPLAPA